MKASRLFSRALILSVTLAVALTGCGKQPKKSVQLATYGQASCDYIAGNKQRNLGNFDVQIVLTKQAGTYALYVTPISLAVVGDLVTISIFGEGGIYRELVPQLQPVVGKTIPTALLTEDDLLKYNTLVVALYQPGVTPPESTASRVNICPLVQLGDGVNQ